MYAGNSYKRFALLFSLWYRGTCSLSTFFQKESLKMTAKDLKDSGDEEVSLPHWMNHSMSGLLLSDIIDTLYDVKVNRYLQTQNGTFFIS